MEYDIGSSSDDFLEIFSLDRMEQVAVPLTGIVWPPPKDLDPEEFNVDLPAILVANDEVSHIISVMNMYRKEERFRLLFRLGT